MDSVKKKKACALCLIITILSFFGFVVENLWMALSKGYMNNRNMILPFLFGYGLAVIVMYLMFGTPRAPRLCSLHLDTGRAIPNALIHFGLIFLCISLGEILLGTFVEWTCGIVWWNYTCLPLHITKYTSVFTSVGFALLITIFTRYLLNPIAERLMRMPERLMVVLSFLLMGLMIVDFLHSAVYMFLNGDTLHLWRIELTRMVLRLL